MATARIRKKKQSVKDAALQDTACWQPSPGTKGMAYARCSACGFETESSRAVETGWNATEYVAVKYRYCPMCGKRMSVPDAISGT